jgi:hypothetical protein
VWLAATSNKVNMVSAFMVQNYPARYASQMTKDKK